MVHAALAHLRNHLSEVGVGSDGDERRVRAWHPPPTREIRHGRVEAGEIARFHPAKIADAEAVHERPPRLAHDADRGQTPRVHQRERLQGASRGKHTRDLVAGSDRGSRAGIRPVVPSAAQADIVQGSGAHVAELVPARVEEADDVRLRQNSVDAHRVVLNIGIVVQSVNRDPVARDGSAGHGRDGLGARLGRVPSLLGGTRREDEPEEAASNELQEGQVALAGVHHAPVLVAAQLCARFPDGRREERVTCGGEVVLCHGLDPLAATLVFEYSLHDGGLEGRPRKW